MFCQLENVYFFNFSAKYRQKRRTPKRSPFSVLLCSSFCCIVWLLLLGADFFDQLCCQFCHRHAAQIFAVTLADCDCLFFAFLVADSQHIRHLFHRCLTDLPAHLFGTAVHLDTQTSSFQFLLDLICKVQMTVCNGHQTNLI